MKTDQLLQETKDLIRLAEMPDGPATTTDALMMAIATALMAIAAELKRANDITDYERHK